jgi:hypothetical protein
VNPTEAATARWARARLLVRFARLGWLAGVAGLACASTATPGLPEALAELRPQRREIAVPFFPQSSRQCGPAALAMALRWSGDPAIPDDLKPEVFTPGRKGTLQSDLVGAARRHGRIPYPVAGLGALIGELAAGHPVLVLQNLGFSWIPVWHYAVAIGYDGDAGELILHSGRSERYAMPIFLFDRTWARGERWARVILPPGELPAAGGEQSALEAIAAAEQAGAARTAAGAYLAATVRWPGSGRAWLGVGNTRYAERDLAGAAAAFQRAAEVEPGLAAAWNNLAHVQAELGERGAARATIERALKLGGPQQELYLRTLAEIEGR